MNYKVHPLSKKHARNNRITWRDQHHILAMGQDAVPLTWDMEHLEMHWRSIFYQPAKTSNRLPGYKRERKKVSSRPWKQAGDICHSPAEITVELVHI